MTIPICVILGGLLSVLVGLRVFQWWQRAQRSRRDIDRLVEQFQALFRQLDEEKHSCRPIACHPRAHAGRQRTDAAYP